MNMGKSNKKNKHEFSAEVIHKPIFENNVIPSKLPELMNAADLLGLGYNIEKVNVGTNNTKIFTYKIAFFL